MSLVVTCNFRLYLEIGQTSVKPSWKNWIFTSSYCCLHTCVPSNTDYVWNRPNVKAQCSLLLLFSYSKGSQIGICQMFFFVIYGILFLKQTKGHFFKHICLFLKWVNHGSGFCLMYICLICNSWVMGQMFYHDAFNCFEIVWCIISHLKLQFL